ncbi:acyltransferase family protein [Raoultella lignicola]|uniref:Acyltransferase family protein n=1 Tax=Raoultella lignicola TaxID=3040939 RepID=A0ABU9F301_9ENTR
MSTQEKNGTILWINTLKGACILLVILHHSIITTLTPSIDYLSSGVLPARLWDLFNKSVSPLRMPAFFFVSGLLASSAVLKKNWTDVFTKKVSNLLYLYILWGFLQWLFIKKIITEPMGVQLSNAENSAYATSIYGFSHLLFSASTSLWYLYALAGYFFITKILNKQRYITITLAVILNYLPSLGVIESWGLISISQNMIFFVVGVYFSKIIINWCEIKKENIIPWTLIFILALANIKLGVGKNIFICVMAIILSIKICQYLNDKFDMSWLNWIGKNTLQIYVIHRIYVEIFGISLLHLGVDDGLFMNHTYSMTWSIIYPLVSVFTYATLSIFTWKLLNNGYGKNLFSHPGLVNKKPQQTS